MSPDKDDTRARLGLVRRMEEFERMYVGTPPWDIGRPQGTFLTLAQAGAFQGRVLDVGCGTGEHTLLAARLGLDATGVDLAEVALERARGKAQAGGLSARFLSWDTRDLASLGERFDTALDCGMFHVLEDPDRPRFVEGLRAVLAPGGRYFMLCFSDQQPGVYGPRRVTQAELRASFAHGWRVDSIEPTLLELIPSAGSAHAWLAIFTRL
jgi:2-polyprenyl-3-methyl-5-hydroxy-6-metoxy-1,4-benzoquinol methylase